METIQIVIDKKLLEATDRLVQRRKTSRLALVRDALREHIRRLKILAVEQRDKEGYSAIPESAGEADAWEAEASWPTK